MHPDHCPLCQSDGGHILWRNDKLRIVDVDDGAHPGFTRVIWQDHIAEMTQLARPDRQLLMEAVSIVEQAQRDSLQPDKINLAQFGNMVPHLHWHVVPRWSADAKFPEAVWAPAPARTSDQQEAWRQRKSLIALAIPNYHAALLSGLSQL